MAFVDFTRLQAKLFALMGFNILSEDNPCPNPIISFGAIISLSMFCVSLFSYCTVHISNVEDATDSLSSVLTATSCVQKLIMFYIHRKRFAKLIGKLGNMSTKGDPAEERILKVENRKVTFITKLYTCEIGISAVSVLVIPLGKMVYLFRKYEKIVYSVPLNGLYPFNWEHPFGYVLIYCWNISSVFVVAIFTASVDTLFTAMCLNVCAQLRILNRKITLLRTEDIYDLEKEVEDIISQHQMTLRLVKEMNALFRPVVFVQFLISALQLGAAGFQVAVSWNDPRVLYFGCYLITAVVQLFIYCYCGDRIQSESVRFATHVYLGYWYTFPPKIVRCLGFSMMRSQKHSKLDGYFFEANLITFNSIITTTMSYITFLLSFLE